MILSRLEVERTEAGRDEVEWGREEAELNLESEGLAGVAGGGRGPGGVTEPFMLLTGRRADASGFLW